MDEYIKYIESILLISDKPISTKYLSEKLEINTKDTKELIEKIKEKFNTKESGIHLIESWGKIQFTTNPECENIIKDIIKEELNSNLTDASLETLTIIAYRSPITKSEIEQIRGINCSLILKNLLIKGLIECKFDKEKMSDIYNTTVDFLKYLGINNIEELPNYENLNKNQIIQDIINQQNQDE
ncbi:MAG: SMC-Scp complex subunit ScpB [Patescibacteria group bacterium]|nr:SMC-Scp complex subunit ScpB [Patescibacteria group bacterium]MDD4304367.1 SMC-Scp complex subunit ScpB [Patescibacteria group bacterium]MDD4695390.1 SMC-Scp complex subunit ScpB [Patescibacteria group bacterium]